MCGDRRVGSCQEWLFSLKLPPLQHPAPRHTRHRLSLSPSLFLSFSFSHSLSLSQIHGRQSHLPFAYISCHNSLSASTLLYPHQHSIHLITTLSTPHHTFNKYIKTELLQMSLNSRSTAAFTFPLVRTRACTFAASLGNPMSRSC